jgi:hypothetical protein
MLKVRDQKISGDQRDLRLVVLLFSHSCEGRSSWIPVRDRNAAFSVAWRVPLAKEDKPW